MFGGKHTLLLIIPDVKPKWEGREGWGVLTSKETKQATKRHHPLLVTTAFITKPELMDMY